MNNTQAQIVAEVLDRQKVRLAGLQADLEAARIKVIDLTNAVEAQQTLVNILGEGFVNP